MAEEENPLGL